MGDREAIGRRGGALNDASRREEAARIIRGLIDSVVLRPSAGAAAKSTRAHRVASRRVSVPRPRIGGPISLWPIYRDRRFWRLAPLSAIGIGTSWSFQGSWGHMAQGCRATIGSGYTSSGKDCATTASIAPTVVGSSRGGEILYTFDIRIQGDKETVLFDV